MKRYILATDGSSVPNPGAGSIACVVREYTGTRISAQIVMVRDIGDSTNNLAEINALYFGLHLVDTLIPDDDPYDSTIVVVTDSANLIGWMDKDWKINEAHIRKAIESTQQHVFEQGYTLCFEKVKGHLISPTTEYERLNEMCDTMINQLRYG